MFARTESDESLLTGYTGRLFLTVSIGWLVFRMGRAMLPPLLSTLIEQLAITPAKAGVGLTLMWGLYALSQYPSGRLSDRLSRKTLLVASLGLLLIGFLVLFGTVTYPIFLLATVIIGIGGGLYPTAARALVSDLFVERRGQAFGVHDALGSIGSALAAGVAVVALSRFVWQSGFLPVVFGVFAVLVGLHVWSRESYVLTGVDLGMQETGGRILRNRRNRWLLASYILYSFTWQSVTSFLPTFLELEKGFPISVASGGFAALFIVGAVVKPVAGNLGDRFSPRIVAVGALLVGMAGLFAVVVADSMLFSISAVVVFAVGLMSYPPVMQTHLMNRFDTESMGGDLGAMRTMYIGLASLGPTYVGYVAGVGSYGLAFLGIVVLLGVSTAIIGIQLFEDRRNAPEREQIE
jgi:MFS family permease